MRDCAVINTHNGTAQKMASLVAASACNRKLCISGLGPAQDVLYQSLKMKLYSLKEPSLSDTSEDTLLDSTDYGSCFLFFLLQDLWLSNLTRSTCSDKDSSLSLIIPPRRFHFIGPGISKKKWIINLTLHYR